MRQLYVFTAGDKAARVPVMISGYANRDKPQS